MRVCMLSREHSSHAGAGGLAIAAGNTARVAAEAGHEVVLVTTQRSDGFSGWSEEAGVQVYWLPLAVKDGAGTPGFWAAVEKLFPSLHAKRKFDLVHGQSGAAASLVGATGGPNVLAKLGLPCVMQDHGLGPAEFQDMLNVAAFQRTGATKFKDSVYRFMDSLYLTNFRGLAEPDMLYMRRYARILATSSISKWDLMTRYGLTNVDLFLHCIYGVDGKVRKAAQPPVILFFALSLDNPYKSALCGLKALVPIKDKITVRLIGRGPKSAAFAKANFPRVEAMGFIPEKKAIDALKTTDVLVECSLHHRGLNLTGITALGMGVPIVTFPTGGHIDMVGEHGEAGILVDPLKPEELRKAVLKVAATREKYSSGALDRFRTLFAPPVVGKRLSRIYASVMK